MIILGAGMAGCIAAIMNPKAIVLEAATNPPTNHSAVLRFQTNNISKITGIPFRKVLVRKAIYYNGAFYNQPNPLLANLYAQKVIGKILPRSIWNTNPVERYVAPPDFHAQMLDMVAARLHFGQPVQHIGGASITAASCYDRQGVPILSTIPMPVLAKTLNMSFEGVEFSHSSIYVEQWRIRFCDIHQTIYFPEITTPLYRASITGDILALEAASHSSFLIDLACEAFGINMGDCTLIKSGQQKYGKIAPVDDIIRKTFMFQASQNHGVYSLGRFACWRNVMLDDVYEDVFKIRNMILQSPYDVKKELS